MVFEQLSTEDVFTEMNRVAPCMADHQRLNVSVQENVLSGGLENHYANVGPFTTHGHIMGCEFTEPNCFSLLKGFIVLDDTNGRPKNNNLTVQYAYINSALLIHFTLFHGCSSVQLLA